MGSTVRSFPPMGMNRAGTVREIEFSEDEESEDEETRLQREEEEQELELSRLHGEAVEGRGEKRAQTAEEIEAEYEKKTKSIKRQKRPALTVDMITGVNGLVRLPVEFKQIPFRGEKSIASAASYSLRLVEAYKKFCFDLMPSMAFEDVLLKIEKEGGTRQVKDYLQTMRNAQRDQFVESLYGKEKADQFLTDLQVLVAEQEMVMPDADFEPQSASTPPTLAMATTTDDARDVATPGAASSMSENMTTNNNAREVSPPIASNDPAKEDEEENEFDFDEDNQLLMAEEITLRTDQTDEAAPFLVNKRRRFILEDSSDEEDKDDDDDDDDDDDVEEERGPSKGVADGLTDDDASIEKDSVNTGDDDITIEKDRAGSVLPITEEATGVSVGNIAVDDGQATEQAFNADSLDLVSGVDSPGDFPRLQLAQTQPLLSLASQSTTFSNETATILGTGQTMQTLSPEEGNSTSASP
jgi:hypothetical protein